MNIASSMSTHAAWRIRQLAPPHTLMMHAHVLVDILARGSRVTA